VKISLRLDQLDSHAHFAVFVNGGKAGDLRLTRDEWPQLAIILERGCSTVHNFVINDNRKGDHFKVHL